MKEENSSNIASISFKEDVAKEDVLRGTNTFLKFKF